VSTLQRLLTILDIALSTVGGIIGGPIGGGMKLADAALKIAEHANAVYQAETGQPIDLSKIPAETPVP